jgi:predicted membrane protein
MIRLDDNEDNNPKCKTNKPDKRLGIGIVFIFLGALFLFNNIGLIPQVLKHYFFSWQMIIIVIGLFMMAGNKSQKPGLIMICVGVLFIVPGLFGFERIRLGQLWPVVFVAIGLYILLRHKKHMDEPDDEKFESKKYTNAEDIIDDATIFGGSVKNIRSKNFQGGRLTAIFGGADYNFSDADLSGGQATIDVLTIFGGTKMVVPSDWDVIIDVVPVFGGFADKRNTLHKIQINTNKKLIIKGMTIFGGGEIKSM